MNSVRSEPDLKMYTYMRDTKTKDIFINRN